MLAMIDGDTAGAREALQTETLSLDQVQSAYERAKECYQNQPSPTGVEEYRKLLKDAFRPLDE